FFTTPCSSNTSENVQYDISSTSPSHCRMVSASHGPMNEESVTMGRFMYVALNSLQISGSFGMAEVAIWLCTFPTARHTIWLREVGSCVPNTSSDLSSPYTCDDTKSTGT